MGRGSVAVMACFAAVAVGVGLVVPRLPSLAFGVVAALGASAAALSVALARMGRTLDPAFVVLGATFLIVPWGVLNLFESIPMPAAMIGLTPFVAAAWWIRPRARRQSFLLVPLLLLTLYAAISLAWSLDPAYGREKLYFWLFTGLIPAAFVLVLAASSGRISWTLILAVSVLTSAYFLLMGTPDPEYGLTPTIFGWNPIWSARAAYIGALIALFGPFPHWVRLLVLPILLMHGWTSVSLGPAVGLVLGAGAGILETLRLREAGSRRARVGLLGIWLMVGCVLLVFLTGNLESGLMPVVDDPNVSSRADYLAATPPLFIASPVVGTGVGGFAITGFFDGYPHNLPVEIAVELGFVGFLVLLAWWLLALRGAAGSPILVALLVATSVFSLFSGSLASNTEFWLFSGLAVAMLPIGRERTRQRTNSLAPRASRAQVAAPAVSRGRLGDRPDALHHAR